MRSLQTDQRIAKEINLKEILGVLKKRAWIGILVTVISALIGFFYSSINQTTLLYSTSTNIIINADGGQRKTLEVIIKDKTVLEKVIKQLGIEKSPESLAQNIQVGSIDDTQVVKISVIDVNPELAAAIANTTAKVFIEEIPEIMNFNDVRVLSDAQVNLNPINQSNENKILLSAIIGGMVIGIGLIFLVDSLDESVRSEHEIENLLEVPILGAVSTMSKKNVSKTKQVNVMNRGESIGL